MEKEIVEKRYKIIRTTTTVSRHICETLAENEKEALEEYRQPHTEEILSRNTKYVVEELK